MEKGRIAESTPAAPGEIPEADVVLHVGLRPPEGVTRIAPIFIDDDVCERVITTQQGLDAYRKTVEGRTE
jgi:hypothetical protein